MSKAFTKEGDGSLPEGDSDMDAGAAVPPGAKNYITPQGYARLRAELLDLIDNERPQVVEAVHWAAKNGDRSENGDYIYGKKRLREIDRRIRFLTQRLRIAQVVDASVHCGADQIFFGASVSYVDQEGVEHQITIVGSDEARTRFHEVSWLAPVARAFLKARAGDQLRLTTPKGVQEVEILTVEYPPAPAPR